MPWIFFFFVSYLFPGYWADATFSNIPFWMVSESSCSSSQWLLVQFNGKYTESNDSWIKSNRDSLALSECKQPLWPWMKVNKGWSDLNGLEQLWINLNWALSGLNTGMNVNRAQSGLIRINQSWLGLIGIDWVFTST